MAKVALRVYNHEIESMIEGGQLDEAVAHCQHILKTFSMHIETYRLFGKTFLEARRYADAADIFERVLMAVPDDFVSHVGMSIIQDDAGKLDDSIWHMERAFEVQPSNPAIQGELRRLYGRRDGVEPPKIRLSRDALANMYSQGELFDQAIAEIRSVLADDPNRPDLQVMLGRAYFQAGKKVEAAEMAANLLKKYQYCMDALRILVDVLPGTARADSTQVYSQRLCMLDPYSSFASGSVFGSDHVADAAVNLERLEYKQGGSPMEVDPNWATSLGIKLDPEKENGTQPEQLSGKHEPEGPDAGLPADSVAGSPEGSAMAAEESEPIPEWMRSSGWQGSTGAVSDDPAQVGTEGSSELEPIAQAEIPDWLKSMAPPGINRPDSVEPVPAETENGDFPSWLTDQAANANTGKLTELSTEGFGLPAAQEPLVVEPLISTPDVLPPVIQEPDVLPPVIQEPAALPPVIQEPAILPLVTQELDDGQSLKSSSLESQQADTPFQPTGEAKPLGIEDDTFSWLESLAAKQGAKPEELLTNPEERSGEIPEWLRGHDVQAASSEEKTHAMAAETPWPLSPLNIPSAPVSETPTSVSGDDHLFQPSGEVKPLGIEDDTFSWLEKLAAKQGAKPEELLTSAEERSELPPEWVPTIPLVEKRSPEPGELVAGQPLEATPAEPVDVPSAPELGSAAGDLPSPRADKPSLASWLSRLDETPDVQEPTPEAIPPSVTSVQIPAVETSLPDWLKDLEKPASLTDSHLKASRPSESASDVPEWLRETGPIGENAPVGSSEPAQTVDHEMPTWIGRKPPALEKADPISGPEMELPSWIDEKASVPDSAAPTDPKEWLPVQQKPLDEFTRETPKMASEKTVPRPFAMHTTGMLARIPDQDKDGDLLARAQVYLDKNRLNEAMQEYLLLIKKGRLLEEVIHDLREAIYRFPVDVIIWQTLGDACMRANRLQDALDAYTKAEELLR